MRMNVTPNTPFNFDDLIDAVCRAASGAAEPADILDFKKRWDAFAEWYRDVYWPAARQQWPNSSLWKRPAQPGPGQLDNHLVREAQARGYSGPLFREYLETAHRQAAAAAGTGMSSAKRPGGFPSSVGARTPQLRSGSRTP